jgi:hypothetical protein
VTSKWLFSIALLFLSIPTLLFAQDRDGVIARCGASDGMGYYFRENATGNTDGTWQQDGISSGKIVLVRLGEQWDIQFDDAIGAAGYRNDGARVIFLGGDEEIMRIGAFHENYVDIYSFDLVGKKVAWTSSKNFPFAKVGAYLADCE